MVRARGVPAQRDEAEVAARLGREASARAEKKAREKEAAKAARPTRATKPVRAKETKRGAKRGDEGSPLGCDGGRGDGAAPPVPRWGANALKHWDQITDRMRAATRTCAGPEEWGHEAVQGPPDRGPVQLASSETLTEMVRHSRGGASAWLALAEREYAYMIARTAPRRRAPRGEARRADEGEHPVSGRIIEKHIIEFVLEAEQPIKHLSESFGNSAIIASRKIRQDDGSIARVPMISGDAMRHGLRAASAWIPVHATNGEKGPQLSEAALRLLFAGGMVTGQGDAGSVRMGEYRKMIEMVPQLAFLGGCAENRTIPARSPWTTRPSCAPRKRASSRGRARTPRRWGARTRRPIASIEEVQRVRMDPSLRPDLRRLLDAGDSDMIERRLEASERASREGDAGAKDAAKSTMMPRRFERIVQGALFFWRVGGPLRAAGDGRLLRLARLPRAAHGGGRRSQRRARQAPCGGRAPHDPQGLSLSAPESIGLARRGLRRARFAPAGAKVGEAFVTHLQERAEKITEYLRTVNA